MEKAFEESIQSKEGTLLQYKRLELINEEMISKMNEQEDERFKNSKFLNFYGKI